MPGDGGERAAADDGLPPLRDVIREHGLSAKKNLGQNFILDLNLTRRIARVCGDLSSAVVIEVGPGPGGLTRGLLSEGALAVIAIERDERCADALAMIEARWPGKLQVNFADASTYPWADMAEIGAKTGASDVYIIANLPYGIATSLLVSWLSIDPWPPWFSAMGLMFQREVAERIVAAPGSKAYGRLSVISQWCCEARIALTLSPAAFTPPPKVASAVLRFSPRAERHPACALATLERVTAAAFGQRRKMLRASLKSLTASPELLLEQAGIDPELRAEQVDVPSFARLAMAYDAGGDAQDGGGG